jgi:hypothetical protein
MNGCTLGETRIVDGKTYTEVLPGIEGKADFCFDGLISESEVLVVSFLSLCPLQLEFYWHDGDGYTSTLAQYYIVH